MIRKILTCTGLAIGFLAATGTSAIARLPFTHATVSGGVQVTSITDEQQNQGNIEVGDVVIRATRIMGNISRVRTSGQLEYFAQESLPARMIFLHVKRADTGKVEIRIAPLSN